MSRTLKFGFIGCGKMARFHADVIKHLGHEISIVVARENSINIEEFRKKYHVPLTLKGIGSLLSYAAKHKDCLDALIICTPWDVNESVLKGLLPLDIPMLIEKPAVLSLKAFNEIKKDKTAVKNICVAYNRRHYDFIPHLVDLVKKKKILCVDVFSADSYALALKSFGPKIKNHMLHYYAIHVIDLMFYLFGEIKINLVHPVLAGDKRSFVADLYSKTCQCPIQFKSLMDSPQNSYVKIFFEDSVAVLSPFEKLTIYDRIEKKENKGNNVYSPRIKEEFEVKTSFKPGLFNQMNYFINEFVSKRNTSVKEMNRLKQVTSFCETLLAAKGKLYV